MGEHPIREAAGRDDVDVIDFERLPVSCLLNLKASHSGQQLRHQALVRRIEVNDDDEDQSAVGWDSAEECLECLEAAG